MLKFIVLFSKGLVRDQRSRRLAMFYGLLAAMVMLFAGSTFLAAALRQNPLVFMIYWAGCATLTLLAFLLAVFDLLLLRALARRARRQLEADCVNKKSADASSDSQDPL